MREASCLSRAFWRLPDASRSHPAAGARTVRDGNRLRRGPCRRPWRWRWRLVVPAEPRQVRQPEVAPRRLLQEESAELRALGLAPGLAQQGQLQRQPAEVRFAAPLRRLSVDTGARDDGNRAK